MNKIINDLIVAHAGLPTTAGEITPETDLYRAGMKSFASVQLMLALEEEFDIEFPEEMLTRATFRTPASIISAVETLALSSVAA